MNGFYLRMQMRHGNKSGHETILNQDLSMQPGKTRSPLTTGPPDLLWDYTLANFLMALQMTGLTSRISKNFRQNAGTVTSPCTQICPLIMGLCSPASNLSFRGPAFCVCGVNARVFSMPPSRAKRSRWDLLAMAHVVHREGTASAIKEGINK